MNHLVRRLAPLLIALVATPALAAAPAKRPAPAHPAPAAAKDWSQVAVRDEKGSFVQGNPNARVKLVEYLSFTCPHCAAFEAEAHKPLTEKYIRTGLVSYEVRIALRDGFDLAAAMLSRCQGPRAFFAVKPAVFAAQPEWEAKGGAWGQTAPDLSKMKPSDAARALATGSGLDQFFLAHGLPKAKLDACLADDAEQQRLSDTAQVIWQQPNFPGTPAFLINGAQTNDVHSWADLEPKLRAALG